MPDEKNTMDKRTKIILIGLAVLLGGAFLVWKALDRSLGKPLELEARQATSRPAAPPATQPATQPADQPATPPAAQPAAGQVDKTCGASGQIDIQVIGLTVKHDEPLDADLIRLVHLDFDQPAVTVIALPRTLWVETVALENPPEPETYLGQVYTLAKAEAQGQPERARHEKAAQVFAQTVLDNFGYAADHYITVDPIWLIKMVDTLGGIDVVLPLAVDATSEELGSFPAGPQHLDGTRTLNLARTLFPASGVKGEWERIDRQNVVLQGLLATLRQPENWFKAPVLARDFHQMVVTSLSINDIRSLLCMLELYGDSVNLVELPPQLMTGVAEERLLVDREQVREWIESQIQPP